MAVSNLEMQLDRCLKCHSSVLKSSSLKHCLAGHSAGNQPVILSVVTKARRDGSKLLFIITKEDRKDQEATAGVAAAKETSVDAAAAAVSSELGGIFAFKEEQRTAANAFLCENDVFALV